MNLCDSLNLQIAHSSQILLKFLTDSIRRHIHANKVAIHVTLNNIYIKLKIYIYIYIYIFFFFLKREGLAAQSIPRPLWE
jgi:hypothetical protein